MRRRKHYKISRRAAFGTAILMIVLALIAAAVIKIDKAVKPVAIMQAEHYARLSTEKVISRTVADYLESSRFTYGDFVAVLYDENGKAVSVEAIPYNINKAQSELTMLINNNFDKSRQTYTEIPVGSLTDSYMLAGKGPKIRVRICPSGNASVKLRSTFSSAGINQTCHRISAVVTAQTESSIPLYSFDTEMTFEFLLAESILIGNVPDLAPYAWNDLVTA